MASLWDDVKNAIVDGYVYAADKAEELSQIGKAKVEILQLNRQIARTISSIGGHVYDLFEKHEQATKPEDTEIRESVQKIEVLHGEIERLRVEIEKIKAEREARGGEDVEAEAEAKL